MSSCRFNPIYLFLFLLLSSCAGGGPPKDKPEKPIFVKFEAASLAPIKQEFETAGEIKPDKEITVSAERQGQVEQIFVREGQYVNAGTSLVKIKGDDIAADLSKAKQDYQIFKNLYEQGAISKLDLLGYETNLKKFESVQDNLLIKAISPGTIGQIYIDPGDYLTLGASILELVKLQPLRVSYTIPERLLAKVKLGQSVTLSTSSYPDQVFNAKVDFISPRVDKETRTVLVRARIHDPGKLLKANQFVTVKQIIKDLKETLLVREESVYLDQGQEYVFIAQELEENNKESTKEEAPKAPGPPPPTHYAKRVAIKTGLRKPGFVQILEGVELGDDVIYAGLTSIYPGAKLVRVQEEEQS